MTAVVSRSDRTTASDADLLEDARLGSAGAFAVLLHRHAGGLAAALAGQRDLHAALVAVLRRAMDEVGGLDPGTPVAGWLEDVAQRTVRGPLATTTTSTELPPELLDAVWRELAPHWPGLPRRRRRPPVWLRLTGLTAALVAVAVLIPYLLLTLGQERAPTGPPPLRSVPVEQPADDDTGSAAVDPLTSAPSAATGAAAAGGAPAPAEPAAARR